ncbi:MAG: hypothetical protein IKF09_02610 [Clostridiales bacterium]|nr:hypothetical protein [Clostridiales bacterium]
MKREDLPKDFLEVLDSVTNKRARFVIDTILEKGSCTTEDLKNGGYEHAPRAARDVRELGIPLVTGRGKDKDGKNIAVYTFGDWEEAKRQNQLSKTGGRTQLTAKLKAALIKKYGCRCNLYGEEYPERLLQPDHRIPYEIGGDPEDMMDTDRFMLLCPSANRDKSWTCEHCPNWINKDPEFCRSCYYAYPESYTHIAGEHERKIDLIFKGEDSDLYIEMQNRADANNKRLDEYIKSLLYILTKKNNK